MILIIIAGILIILLCFVSKEGFYSDNNISSAFGDIKQLKSKIKNITTNLDTLSKEELSTLDIISKLNPVLETDKESLFKNGVIVQVKSVIKNLSDLQTDFKGLNDSLLNLRQFKEAFSTYLTKLDNIQDALNKLPDS